MSTRWTPVEAMQAQAAVSPPRARQRPTASLGDDRLRSPHDDEQQQPLGLAKLQEQHESGMRTQYHSAVTQHAYQCASDLLQQGKSRGCGVRERGVLHHSAHSVLLASGCLFSTSPPVAAATDPAGSSPLGLPLAPQQQQHTPCAANRKKRASFNETPPSSHAHLSLDSRLCDDAMCEDATHFHDATLDARQRDILQQPDGPFDVLQAAPPASQQRDDGERVVSPRLQSLDDSNSFTFRRRSLELETKLNTEQRQVEVHRMAARSIQRVRRLHKWRTIVGRLTDGGGLPRIHGLFGSITLFPISDTQMRPLGLEGPSGRQYRGRVLCLAPHSAARVQLVSLVETQLFQALSLLAIVANCVLMAMEPPSVMAHGAMAHGATAPSAAAAAAGVVAAGATIAAPLPSRSGCSMRSKAHCSSCFSHSGSPSSCACRCLRWECMAMSTPTSRTHGISSTRPSSC